MHDDWQQHETAHLIELWNVKRLSASMCARGLPGRTRNSVLSKVKRLRAEGVAMRAILSGARAKPKTEQRALHGAKLRLDGPPLAPASLSETSRALEALLLGVPQPRPEDRINLIDDLKDHHCRYIYGDPHNGPGHYAWCGAHRMPGAPYCLWHRRLTGGPKRVLDQPLGGHHGTTVAGPCKLEVDPPVNATRPQSSTVAAAMPPGNVVCTDNSRAPNSRVPGGL